MNKVIHKNCEIIKDLLPLYIDECCSEESAEAVETHLKECTACKAVFDNMSSDSIAENGQESHIPQNLNRIKDWKASILQSMLLFISFAVLSVGITLEAYTPYGVTNGIWAFAVIVPTAGFMLSLSNWYFVRGYKSKRSFSNCSCLLTLVITICCYVWAIIHFRTTFFELSGSVSQFFAVGFAITVALCIISKIVSGIYAKMLGKE